MTSRLPVRRLFSSRLLRATVALYFIQGARYVAPLIILPWLARVLRPETLGVVVAVQSFGAWNMLLVDYGFPYGGPRETARLRDDPAALRAFTADLQGGKLGLAAASVGVLAASALSVPLFRDHPVELILAWAASILLSFTPLWYFQGTERTAIVTAVEALAQLAAALAIVLTVKTPADGAAALAIYLVAAVLSTGTLTVWMYREIPFACPSPASSARLLRRTTSLFVFRGGHGLITAGNGFLLSFFASPATVGHYGAAERLIRAVGSALGPLSQAFYPRISRLLETDVTRAAFLARVAALVLGAIAVGALTVLSVGADRLVLLLFGVEFAPAAPLVRILSVLLPAIAAGTTVGVLWALPLGWDRTVAVLVATAGLINVTVALVLVPAFGASGMAWTVVAAELIMPVGLVILLTRRGLGFWQSRGAGLLARRNAEG